VRVWKGICAPAGAQIPFHTLTWARRRRVENCHTVTFEKPCYANLN